MFAQEKFETLKMQFKSVGYKIKNVGSSCFVASNKNHPQFDIEVYLQSLDSVKVTYWFDNGIKQVTPEEGLPLNGETFSKIYSSCFSTPPGTIISIQ